MSSCNNGIVGRGLQVSGRGDLQGSDTGRVQEWRVLDVVPSVAYANRQVAELTSEPVSATWRSNGHLVASCRQSGRVAVHHCRPSHGHAHGRREHEEDAHYKNQKLFWGRRQVVCPPLSENNDVLDPDAEPPGQIHAGLDRDRGADREHVLHLPREPRPLVDLIADAMTQAVRERVSHASLLDNVPRDGVQLASRHTRVGGLARCDLRAEAPARTRFARLRQGPRSRRSASCRCTVRRPRLPCR